MTDERMRWLVLRDLNRQRLVEVDHAENLDRRAADPNGTEHGRRILAEHAIRHRRQAAHYQQAIDLLTAAPMPPEV